jgi:hypothetical protein
MRSITLIILLAAGGVGLAACGSSSNSNTATNAADSVAGGKQGDFLAFSQCMRAHGVPNFPDISHGMRIATSPGSTTVNGVQVNSPAFQSAMQTCRSKLPDGGNPGPPSQSQRRRALAFSQCMRSHGVPNFPDPTFSANGIRVHVGPGSGLDPNSPAFQAAQKACGLPFGKAP